MFKDYHKYLSTSLKVYTFVLVIIFIMKIVGLDYFGLDLDNKVINSLTNVLMKNWILKDIVCFIPLLFNQFVIISLSCNDNSKRVFRYNLILIPIYYLFEVFKIKLFGIFAFVFEILYFFIICKIYNKNVKTKKFIKIIILMLFCQAISMLTRYNYSIEYVTNIVASLILNLDYMILLIIIYKLNFTEGDELECYLDHQFSFSDQLNLSKKQLKKFQTKSLNKKEKFEFIVTWVLYLLWNIFTLAIILFIATLNGTFIECLFIANSFFISKKVFGKPFHLPSMKQCFIVSNLTYYILNRITTPLGISILIPIMLGVGLSYITSKLVKKTYKPLYKGMPNNLFEETILKVTDKDSLEYNICYDYYVVNKTALQVSNKYNYTYDSVKKIFKRVNDKIKGL